MLTTAPALDHLSDADLLVTVARLAAREQQATADLIAALAELDVRHLYLGEGCASLFTYCTERLHLSESAAYHRITAARAAQRVPLILDRLREGALILTAVGLLAPHLTDANCRDVLDAARHQSKRAVEALVARLDAQPDVAPSIRKLPTPRRLASDLARRAAPPASQPGPVAPLVDPPSASPVLADANDASPDTSAPASTSRPAVVRALAPARYQVQVTVSADTLAKLRRAQDLLRHAIPDGDPALVLDRALTVLIRQLERTKCAATTTATRSDDHAPTRPRSRRAQPPSTAGPYAGEPGTPEGPINRAAPGRSRAIRAAVRRAVWTRDGGQCTYVGAAGRCTERGFLEFHHRVPFAAGGEATVDNIVVICRAHNAHEASRYFGPPPGGGPCSSPGPAQAAPAPSTASGGS